VAVWASDFRSAARSSRRMAERSSWCRTMSVPRSASLYRSKETKMADAESKFRVYVVDDDSPVRKSLCALLTAHRLSPVPCESAEQFLESYDESQPGCLLLDLRMPGMNGMELQAMLNRRGADLAIIILTGHGDIPSAVQAMRAGAVDFIEKPG